MTITYLLLIIYILNVFHLFFTSTCWSVSLADVKWLDTSYKLKGCEREKQWTLWSCCFFHSGIDAYPTRTVCTGHKFWSSNEHPRYLYHRQYTLQLLELCTVCRELLVSMCPGASFLSSWMPELGLQRICRSQVRRERDRFIRLCSLWALFVLNGSLISLWNTQP